MDTWEERRRAIGKIMEETYLGSTQTNRMGNIYNLILTQEEGQGNPGSRANSLKTLRQELIKAQVFGLRNPLLEEVLDDVNRLTPQARTRRRI